MGIYSEAFYKHWILFPTVWNLSRLSQGRIPRGKQNVVKKRSFTHEYCWKPVTRHRYIYISEMVEDRWVHAERRLISIEFSFDPCNIYRDGPRGVGYPADARSVGDSDPFLLSLTRRYSLRQPGLIPIRPIMSFNSVDNGILITQLRRFLSTWYRSACFVIGEY